jgi:rhamnulokinase
MQIGFTNEGGLSGTIRFLKNIMGLWLVQELRRAWTAKDPAVPDYGALTRRAGEARAFGPLVDPNWAPFMKPGDMPGKMTRYCKATGQKPPRTQGEFIRCALESLALAYRDALERLRALEGRAVSRIHIIGGGSKNLLLNQLTADACGCEVLAGPDEATALGNILAQMLADSQIASLAEGRAIVAASCEPRRYTPRSAALWNEAYGKFKQVTGKKIEGGE